MDAVIRCAERADVENLEQFLRKAYLSTEGVENAVDYFLILEDEKRTIQATLGIEPVGKAGLLRSLAMTTRTSEQDLLLLFEQALMLARDKQLDVVYLVTNKRASLPFFEMLGFSEVEINELDQHIYQSKHFQNLLSVDNSIFMGLTLKSST